MRRVRGIIRFYRSDRRYGFINYQPAGHVKLIEVFFHIAEFKPDSVPQENQAVEFRLLATPRGPRAMDCVLLIADSDTDETVLHSLRATKFTG